jgi:hypothetical protein
MAGHTSIFLYTIQVLYYLTFGGGLRGWWGFVEQAHSIFYTTTQYCYLTCYMNRREGVVVFELAVL